MQSVVCPGRKMSWKKENEIEELKMRIRKQIGGDQFVTLEERTV